MGNSYWFSARITSSMYAFAGQHDYTWSYLQRSVCEGAYTCLLTMAQLMTLNTVKARYSATQRHNNRI